MLRPRYRRGHQRNASDPQTAAFQEFFKKVRNNEPFTVDNAKNILNKTYFDSLRYDLERVGIYKVNKKFELSARIIGSKTADNVVTEDGELICKKNTVITEEIAAKIEDSGVMAVQIFPRKLVRAADEDEFEDVPLKVIGNGRVDAETFIANSITKTEFKKFDLARTGINEKVRASILREIIEQVKAESKTDIASRLEAAMAERKEDLMPRNLTVDDIYDYLERGCRYMSSDWEAFSEIIIIGSELGWIPDVCIGTELNDPRFVPFGVCYVEDLNGLICVWEKHNKHPELIAIAKEILSNNI